MFLRIYKYKLLTMLRTKETMFWILIFPIILSSLFKFAFSNLLSGENFSKIDVAIINNDEYLNRTDFKSTIEEISKNEDENALLNVKYTYEENAKKMLEEEKVVGYIKLENNEITFYTLKSGINQTIVKTFLDQYLQTSDTIKNIISTNPASLREGLLDDIQNQTEFTEDVNQAKAKADPIVIYFYSIIGMICLFGAFLGVEQVEAIHPSCSTLACRNSISSVSKMKNYLISMFAALTIQMITLLVLFSYLILVLGISFGDQLLIVFLISIIGSIVGISMGSLIAAIFKIKDSAKMGICVAITMLLSFLSGMMGENMKYTIEKSLPIVRWINPVNLITDSYYSLYYYGTYSRVITNVLILSAIAAVLVIAAFIVIRREKYASV